MEAPVAAGLGRLDGLNLCDRYWMDPEYELWYRLLNCGIRLPASTGSDWFLCSANRVYVDVGSTFSYGAWLEGLKAGRTVVTNGPMLRASLEGRAMRVEWEWHQGVDRVQIVADGDVVAVSEEGSARASLTKRLGSDVAWGAGHAWGRRRNSHGHP